MVLENILKAKPVIDDLNDVSPITFNLCLINTKGTIQAELRKRFVIQPLSVPNTNRFFWVDFFEKSLLNIPISVRAQIVFRDKLASKQKFKEFGLLNSNNLNPESVVKEINGFKNEKKDGLLDGFVKEFNSDSMQAMAKNSKKWADEEFFK